MCVCVFSAPLPCRGGSGATYLQATVSKQKQARLVIPNLAAAVQLRIAL